MSTSKTHWAARISILVLMGSVAGLLLLAFRSHQAHLIQAAPIYAFEGTVQKLGKARMTLSEIGDYAVVVLESADGQRSWRFHGTFRNGQFHGEQSERWTQEEAPENGRGMQASFTANPLALQGIITHVASGQTWEFDLAGVATFKRLSKRSGFRIRNRGWSMEVSSMIPEFIEPNTFAVETMAWLQQEAADEISTTLKEWRPDWRERLDMVLHSNATAAWESETRWTIRHRGERVISLLAENHNYTGGAHGNHASHGYTFWKPDGDVVRIALGDLFRDHSGWETNVASMVIADLVRQRASAVVHPFDSQPYALDLAGQPPTFTISRAGIFFQFDPYEVGSYAEGNFEVFIPFNAVETWLRDDGLVRDIRLASGNRN